MSSIDAKAVAPPKPAKAPAPNGKNRLILVAMRLFAERGFDGVTVRDIAKDAEVSVGLINHHFESKEGLREAVDRYFLETTSKAIARAVEKSGSLDTSGIAAYQSRWIRQYADEWPSFVAYLRRAIIDGSPWGENLFRQYYESIRLLLDRHDAEGRISPKTDRLWLPLLYMFVLIGPLMLDPYIKNMLGKSTYDGDMWGRFQAAVQTLFFDGAVKR